MTMRLSDNNSEMMVRARAKRGGGQETQGSHLRTLSSPIPLILLSSFTREDQPACVSAATLAAETHRRTAATTGAGATSKSVIAWFWGQL